MKLPLLIINFKTYSEASGENAIELVKICEHAKNNNVDILVAPQYTDLKEVSSKTKIKVLAQHIDPVDIGAHTGSVTAKAIKESGAIGTFINHSEKKLTLNDIETCIGLSKKYNLLSFCFVANEKEASDILKFNPDFIVYEPPEFIGTGVSVSKSKPEIITKVVNLIRKINPKVNVLCGAGITNGEDVKISLKLGTKGVVLSSGFVKARDPREVLEDLINGFS